MVIHTAGARLCARWNQRSTLASVGGSVAGSCRANLGGTLGEAVDQFGAAVGETKGRGREGSDYTVGGCWLVCWRPANIYRSLGLNLWKETDWVCTRGGKRDQKKKDDGKMMLRLGSPLWWRR